MQEVNQAFDRLNRNVRKLEPQELRHARWDGWFIKLIQCECENPAWRTLGVVTNARAKRMKDAQFISELVLVLLKREMMGFDQDALDAAYALYDDPEEQNIDIDLDDVTERLTSAKNYLLEVQNENGCIKEQAATFTAFYTLWCAVALHRNVLPAPARFAAQLADFLGKVKQLEAVESREALLTGPDRTAFQRAEEYLGGYRGASTDLGPRTKRLEALLAFIRGL